MRSCSCIAMPSGCSGRCYVVNPLPAELTVPRTAETRTRRDHMKYLTLIRAIALLHQYQRPVQTGADRRQADRVHRGHAGRHREWRTARRMKCWAARSTTSRRRPDACCC